MNILQIDFLQPVYTFTFSNGLIACLIFMGIGTMLDINFLLAKPLQSMFLALCAELGTFAVVPIAYAMGLSRDYGSVTVGKVANFFLTVPMPSVAFMSYAYTTPLISRIFLRGEEVVA